MVLTVFATPESLGEEDHFRELRMKNLILSHKEKNIPLGFLLCEKRFLNRCCGKQPVYQPLLLCLKVRVVASICRTLHAQTIAILASLADGPKTLK